MVLPVFMALVVLRGGRGYDRHRRSQGSSQKQ
jgi:hypothetical protein